MDDKQVDELMTTYTDSLGSYSGPRTAKSHRTALWKPLAITGAGAVVVAIMILAPGRANASSGEKVLMAFQKASYWQQVTKLRNTNTNDWSTSSKTIYCDGKIRTESGSPSSRTLTTIVDGADEFDDFRHLPYILKTKVGGMYKPSDFEDPMAHALRFFRANQNYTRREAKPYRGVEAYQLLAYGATSERGMVITVAKATNLPLLVHTYGQSKLHKFEIRQEYTYDRPSPLPSMTPNPSKPIVDVEAERKTAIDRFSRVNLDTSKPILFDSVLGKNGELWVIFGVKDYSKPCWIPNSTQKGYSLGTMFMMSSYGRSADFFVKSHEIVAYLLIPTTKDVSRPKSFDVEFVHRPMFGGGKPNDGSAKVHLELSESKWSFPEFFPSFALQTPVDFVEDRFWAIRGHTFMAQKQYRDAAECFVKEFAVAVKFQYRVKTDMSNPMEAAAQCYDKLGEHVKAKECRKRLREAAIPK